MMDRDVTRAIAIVPVFDCFVDQAQTLFEWNVGGFSFLQAIRGGILVAVVVWLSSRRMQVARLKFHLLALSLCVVCLVTATVKETITTGSMSATSGIAYLKIAYWLLLWFMLRVQCRTREDAVNVLYGLLAGAILSSLSILYCYVAGLGQYYAHQAVKDSAGGFLTGKYICGNLLVGTVVASYLGYAKRKPLYNWIALLCAAAVNLTYARAGQVALLGLLVWLLWSATVSTLPKYAKVHVIRFLAIAFVGAAVFLAVVGVEDFSIRWGDFTDATIAGSGRATFWFIAGKIFWNGGWSELLLGSGMSQMLDSMDRQYGVPIHTHNDLLDMLLIGGVLGLLAWLSVLLVLAGLIRTARVHGMERMAAVAVAIVFLIQAMLTGQLFGVSPMVAYTFGITAFSVLGASEARRLAVAKGSAEPAVGVPYLKHAGRLLLHD